MDIDDKSPSKTGIIITVIGIITMFLGLMVAYLDQYNNSLLVVFMFLGWVIAIVGVVIHAKNTIK